ncbi:MAG: hypothetical protein U0744_17470 [Gemmataceae bacterium]
MRNIPPLLLVAACLFCPQFAFADVGDPQIGTDHLWYPGELSCSTFDRLFATQATLYQRVTGRETKTDQDKALAAWLWRNTHYWHGEEGAEDLWGKGFGQGGDSRSREYWTGLFAHGFGLCGTTHAQWGAEMHALFGPGRGRDVGVDGHNSFEVFLTGGAYGQGRWALLDHDLSTVIFAEDGKSLLSLRDVQRDWKRLTDRRFKPERQQGWLVCGLHPGDGASYRRYDTAEYNAGYSGPPPMVHLRRGETLRRYLEPGLEDGRTFVYWGRNYSTAGIPGPERSLTWVNQPEKMLGSTTGSPQKPGQARYANAVYTYVPNFADGSYREGVVNETKQAITFEFYTPYIIGATPAAEKAWGIYEPGCRDGLILHGKAGCDVSVSVDQGKSWNECGKLRDTLDLTDNAKGHRQYLLKLHATSDSLRDAGLKIVTVCQANGSVMPRLKDIETAIRFASSRRAVVSAGPNLPQAAAHMIAGRFGSPQVTLEIATPRGEKAVAVYAAAHVASGAPPNPKVKYQIEASADGGKTWLPIAKDWTVKRLGDEPRDFWSQSLVWGEADATKWKASTLQVRFCNDGGRSIARAEVYLVYAATKNDSTKVTFAWNEVSGDRTASHTFEAAGGEWRLPTGRQVRTRWIEMTPANP